MSDQLQDAATVVLLRDGSAGLQIYLLHRVASMAFAAGAHVFPGGRVDPDDFAVVPWFHPDGGELFSQRASAPEPTARALVVAAVRETFEESGVLLARHRSGTVLAADPTGWDALRLALLERRSTFAQVLSQLNAAIDPTLLPMWDHWVTPTSEPYRYDTRFHVAALPVGQATVEVGGEADAVVWIEPAGALSAFRDGSMDLMPPTVAVLSALAGYSATAEVMAAAPLRKIRPLLATAVPGGTGERWTLLDARTGELVSDSIFFE
ncbi:MAG: NUDIX hydrolase [Actinomycetes bacterium]